MTVRIVAQLGFAQGVADAERLRTTEVLSGPGPASAGILAMHAGLHLESSVGGRDVTWDLVVKDQRSARALIDSAASAVTPVAGFMSALGTSFTDLVPFVDSIEAGVPETLDGHLGQRSLVGLKRTLWLRVLPQADSAAVARFEAETPLLAAAIPAIRNWRWSRLRTDLCLPTEGLGWTHLWEQEFEDRAGLEVDYMSSPCHWGYIDRWFDPEMPEQVVDVRLAHLACPETAPVLSWDVGD